MQKYIESTGKTEDAAISAALEKLGLAREEVSVEVLELAKPGFLGIGGTPAKVKVSYEAPDEEPAPVEEAPATPAEKAEEAELPAPSAQEEPKAAKPTATPANDDVSARITTFLSGLLAQMEVNAVPQVSVDDEGNYLVELVGQELGAVIGRRGETLDAIQQLTGYAVNRGLAHRVRVRIDAEGYRSKREESLERMARRTAEKAVRFRRNVTLEPMNAYERHVIHTALQEYPDVTTYSIGTEPNRRTVVAYTPGENR
ncbi:MAG: KH domain-containing protein [Oscillospiraceae bacterium]|nr:KH domain-containing protein [Oscillospiraceae bacterium]